MVMYDKFKTITVSGQPKPAASKLSFIHEVSCNQTKNFQKNFEIWVKKSQYCPKIPEIDLDFFRLF